MTYSIKYHFLSLQRRTQSKVTVSVESLSDASFALWLVSDNTKDSQRQSSNQHPLQQSEFKSQCVKTTVLDDKDWFRLKTKIVNHLQISTDTPTI